MESTTRFGCLGCRLLLSLGVYEVGSGRFWACRILGVGFSGLRQVRFRFVRLWGLGLVGFSV